MRPQQVLPIWVGRPRSNGNEGAFHTQQISRTEASSSDAVKCHTQKQFTSFKGIQSAYSKPCQQGCILR